MFKFSVFPPGLWGFPAMGQGVLEPQEKSVMPYRRAPLLKDEVEALFLHWEQQVSYRVVLILQAETQDTRERVCLRSHPQSCWSTHGPWPSEHVPPPEPISFDPNSVSL